MPFKGKEIGIDLPDSAKQELRNESFKDFENNVANSD